MAKVEVNQPQYWAVIDESMNFGEVFLLPTAPHRTLSTAIEIGMVRALAALEPAFHNDLLAGGVQVSIGASDCLEHFEQVVSGASSPLSGRSILWSGGADIYLSPNYHKIRAAAPAACVVNSFRAAPLKFRFIELYRSMEALYLEEVRNNIIDKFRLDPGTTLSDAQDLLRSEIKQIETLAERNKDAFEKCWQAFESLRPRNLFINALNRKLATMHSAYRSPTWKAGAALIYLMRCAIVHAGQKDLVFDNYHDGTEAVEAVIEQVERASLKLLGIEVV